MSSSQPNLIVHIGPPKTATTSLQIALERNLPASFAYLGAYQPRERNPHNCCHTLNNMVLMNKNSRPEDLSEFLENVEENKTKGIVSLVVEETLMDGSSGVDWRQKIKNLAEVLVHVDAIPAITLRHPLDGIPSLQREYAWTLGFAQKKSIFFLLHPQCRVFDYRYVLENLRKSGFKEVCLLSFSELTNNGLDLSKIYTKVSTKRTLKIGEYNASYRENKYSRKDLLILSYLVRGWIKDFIKLEKFVLQSSCTSIFSIDDALNHLRKSVPPKIV